MSKTFWFKVGWIGAVAFVVFATAPCYAQKVKDLPNLATPNSNSLFSLSLDDAAGGSRHISYGQLRAAITNGISAGVSASEISAIMATNNAATATLATNANRAFSLTTSATNASGATIATTADIPASFTNLSVSVLQAATNSLVLVGFGEGNGTYTNKADGTFTNSGTGYFLSFTELPGNTAVMSSAGILYFKPEGGAWELLDGTSPAGTSYIPTNTATRTLSGTTNNYFANFPGGASGTFGHFGQTITNLNYGPAATLAGVVYDSRDNPSFIGSSFNITYRGPQHTVFSSRDLFLDGQRVAVIASGFGTAIATNADVTLFSCEFFDVRQSDGLATYLSSSAFADYAPGSTAYTINNVHSWTNGGTIRYSTVNNSGAGDSGFGFGPSKINNVHYSLLDNTTSSTNSGLLNVHVSGSGTILTNVANSTILGKDNTIVGATNNVIFGQGLASTSNNVAKFGFTGAHIVVRTNETVLPGVVNGNGSGLTNIPASGLAKIAGGTNAVAWFNSTGVLTATNTTGSGSVVLSNSPTVNNLTNTGVYVGNGAGLTNSIAARVDAAASLPSPSTYSIAAYNTYATVPNQTVFTRNPGPYFYTGSRWVPSEFGGVAGDSAYSLNVYGDSQSAGYLLNSGDSFSAQLAATAFGGLGGAQTTGQTTPSIGLYLRARITGSTILEVGINDARVYGTAFTNDYVGAVRAYANNSLTQKRSTAQAAGTPANWNTRTFQFVSTECLQTTNNYAPLTFTNFGGDTVWVNIIKTYTNDATFHIIIDGVTNGTYSTTGTYTNTDTMFAYEVSGLVKTNHTIQVQKVSGFDTNGLIIHSVSSNFQPDHQSDMNRSPRWIIMGLMKMTSAGYTTWGGSDAIVDAYNRELRAMCEKLGRAGLRVAYFDTEKWYNPNVSGMVQSDGLHFTKAANTAIAAGLYSAFQSRIEPQERAQIQSLLDFGASNLTLTNAAGSKFRIIVNSSTNGFDFVAVP